jgi:hypothetical protein
VVEVVEIIQEEHQDLQAVLVVEVVGQPFIPEEQEIPHQHHRHKEITELLDIMELHIQVEVEVEPVNQVLHSILHFQVMEVLMVAQVLQSLGCQHLMELQALLQVDTLQVVAVVDLILHHQLQDLVELVEGEMDLQFPVHQELPTPVEVVVEEVGLEAVAMVVPESL